jgi:hypothetical protein
VVGNSWPPATASTVPLTAVAATDTTSIWRIEIARKPDLVVRKACGYDPVT